MASLLHVLAPIGRAFRAFFKSDLKLRRGESGLQFVLEETAAPSPDAKGKAKGKRKGKLDAAAEREARDFAAITVSLRALLDQMPENRTVLRHLAFIEHAIHKKGERALYKVPYDVLKHALTQFEGVVVNWSDEGLACLRSKMAVALIDREHNDGENEAINTTAVLDASPSLAHPVTLEGQDAQDAEAALLAAYGAAALPGLDSSAMPLDSAPMPLDDDRPSQFEVQGELASPSGRALVKAAKSSAPREKVDLRLRELQE